MIRRTFTGISVLLILICCFATPAVCQEPVQGSDGDAFLSLLVLFGVVGLAAAVAALAIRMVRRSQ
jgi:hypothetical protein